MRIAGDARLTDAQYIAHLPPSWATLTVLTRLDNLTLDLLFSRGVIRQDMTSGPVLPPGALFHRCQAVPGRSPSRSDKRLTL
jgi:hypothetical protein